MVNMILLNASLISYMEAYGTEEKCVDAIYQSKWQHGFICPRCEHNNGYRLSRQRTMKCSCCGRQTSITADTIFEDSRIPLPCWFLAIYLVANDKGGVSATRLGKQLGMQRKSAALLLRKLRSSMGDRDEKLTLAGYIELDEAFLGGKSHSRTEGKSPFDVKVQVLVMVESDPPGQVFRTDALDRHHGLRSLVHYVNMTKMTKTELNTKMACLSLAISHLKCFIKGTYHHFCKLNIHSYLNEFCYRWNRRHLEKQIASHLITACVLHEAVPAPKRKPRTTYLQAA